MVSYGADYLYISQADNGALVFGGHIDGFNSYTQRGQFANVQTVAESAAALIPSISRLRLPSPLGRHSGHDAGTEVRSFAARRSETCI